jgi:hypothetical protein
LNDSDNSYLDWKEGMEILGKTKQVSGGAWIEGRITESMTCSASLDERGFHMDNLQENWKKINIHIQAEQAHTGAYGPSMKVEEMMDGFKVFTSMTLIEDRNDLPRRDGIKCVQRCL